MLIKDMIIRVFLPLITLLGISLPCLADETSKIIGGLSSGENDLVKGRQVRMLPQMPYQVNWSKVSHKQSRKVTISEVAPPLPKQQVHNLTSQVASQGVSNNPLLKHGGTFMLFAKVYDHRFTKVEWQSGGEKYVALSNVDFNHMNGFTSFEGRGKTYSFMLLCSNASLDDLKINGETPEKKDQLLNGLNKQDPAYTLVEGNPETEEAMEFIEALHDLYAAEKDKLKQAHQARLRNTKIRKKLDRQRRDNQPPKPDLTVYFWKRDVEEEKRQKLQAKGASQ